ncbi:DNA methyltransferase [Fontimonas sp. SYSU GA230001]|uniref:class I SAM-dependent DNA methyltransferase n=1 Tax=Fontimonas sp. SYSU GA230001 TaxID=3142450 RepID=UPI0032B5A587
MDHGGFSAAIAADVLRFNGKLFKHPDTLPLNREQLDLLIRAAKADWKHVEPAIFGTLLERALTPTERHKLGAHYTPRAYVERLVLPTVIEPLREEWSDAQAAALTLAAENRRDEAIAELRRYHYRLCTVRVLDPACGSGNFLYVTLEHLKRLEGEVLNALDDMGWRQTGLALDQERADSTSAETVDPHNLLGIEINPRAAAIAEVVLWIGYLQWHFRTRGDVQPPVPVIRDFRNIDNRDAVLAYDRVEFVTDERGVPVTRWDGRTMKVSPVTGEDIPDDSARVPLERYVNPRKAEWPAADFVVGNPPFIGNKRMRTALGDGYVEALRQTWDDVPESADFVMYWWHHAAQLTAAGRVQRFGLITTNSIRQTFNRRVIEAALGDAQHPLALVFAIPDHPWVDTADGAAVRIAMTVAQPGSAPAVLREVTDEREQTDGEVAVSLREKRGRMFADLQIGADVAGAAPLRANGLVSNRGVIPHGEHMVIDEARARLLGLGTVPGLERHLRAYRNGRDLTQTPRGVRVIDLYGLSAEQVRERFPAVYQWLLERVKPERDENKDRDLREKWWLHRRNNEDLRRSLKDLARFIATVQTAKHRFFTFLDADILPDDKLIAIASDDAGVLGVLSAQVHGIWALAAGATLEDRPVYNKSTCFECFPFPAATAGQADRIRALAEQLDAHRKRQQAAHPELTLTGMYNVLEKLRSGEPLSAKERVIHEQGLVSVLRQLHDELDAAVLEAYGWSDLLPLLRVAHGVDAPQENQTRDAARRAFDEAVLERLVALNAERAAEEARGRVRWLRPAFQNPQEKAVPQQAELDTDGETETEAVTPVAALKAQPWPKDAVAQVRAVADVLSASVAPLSADDIAARFTGRGPWKKRLPQLLDMLVALGRAQEQNGRYLAGR